MCLKHWSFQNVANHVLDLELFMYSDIKISAVHTITYCSWDPYISETLGLKGTCVNRSDAKCFENESRSLDVWTVECRVPQKKEEVFISIHIYIYIYIDIYTYICFWNTRILDMHKVMFYSRNMFVSEALGSSTCAKSCLTYEICMLAKHLDLWHAQSHDVLTKNVWLSNTRIFDMRKVMS